LALQGRQVKPRGAKMAALQRQPEGPPLRAPGHCVIARSWVDIHSPRFLVPDTRKDGAACPGIDDRP
jgi:hypothetical protein